MPRFFSEVTDENDIRIVGDDVQHISRSLRMKVGEDITVTCKGTDYFCRIKAFNDDDIELELVEKRVNKSEPSVKVTLFQAIPKGDKFETIIQKSIELGVNEIIPVMTRRCISRPTEKDFAKKLKRYEKIAESAAKQSGRGIIPEVKQFTTWGLATEMIKDFDAAFILYENGGERFSAQKMSEAKNIAVFIGSEGGFDQQEVDKAVEKGAVPIWLGERILRCETAPMAALAIIMHLTGNM